MENELQTLLSSHEYLFALGEMLAVAILLGGILDRGGRDLLSWVAAVTAFAVVNGILTIDIIPAPSQARIVLASVIADLTTYNLGLLIGWLSGVGFRKLYWRRHHRAEPKAPPCPPSPDNIDLKG